MPRAKTGGGWKSGKKIPSKPRKRRQNFYVKQGTEEVILLLDGDEGPYFVWEHTGVSTGVWRDWRNRYSCACLCQPKELIEQEMANTAYGDASECPACAAHDALPNETLKRQWIGYLTCIQFSGEVTEDGRDWRYQKKLVPLVGDTVDILQKKLEKLGGLSNHVFEVSRAGDKSPRCGNIWEHERGFESTDQIKEYLEEHAKSNIEDRLAFIHSNAKNPEEYTFETVLDALVTPYDYDKVVGPSQGEAAIFAAKMRGGSEQGDNKRVEENSEDDSEVIEWN